MYLAQNLRYLRERKGLTQDGLAKILRMERSTVGNWETGKREPELRMVVRIAEYFRVTLDDLVLKDLRPPIPLYISNVRYLRKKRGMTQREMAVFLGFRDKSRVCLMETGKIMLSIENLERIADLFGVTLDQLVKQDLSKDKGCI